MSYDAQRETAIRLLTAKGTSATITQVVVSAINVSTDTATSVPITMGVVAVVLPATGSQADSFEARTRIRQRFRTVYFSTPTLTFFPKSGDTINWGDGDFVLSGLSPLAPDAGQPILFTANAEVG